MKFSVFRIITTRSIYGLSLLLLVPMPLLAQSQEHLLSSQTDIPEEILETEIILEARSPLDGSLLSPAEYAQLQDELRVQRGEVPGRVAPKIHRAVVLLRLRKVLTTIFPFLL